MRERSRLVQVEKSWTCESRSTLGSRARLGRHHPHEYPRGREAINPLFGRTRRAGVLRPR